MDKTKNHGFCVRDFFLAGAEGIEPPTLDLESSIIPLNYTPKVVATARYISVTFFAIRAS